MREREREEKEEEEEDDEKTQRHGYNLEEVRKKNNTMFGLVEGKKKKEGK